MTVRSFRGYLLLASIKFIMDSTPTHHLRQDYNDDRASPQVKHNKMHCHMRTAYEKPDSLNLNPINPGFSYGETGVLYINVETSGLDTQILLYTYFPALSLQGGHQQIGGSAGEPIRPDIEESQ